VKTLVPPELGSSYTETVYHELIDFIESNNQDRWYEVEDVLLQAKQRLLTKGSFNQWEKLEQLIEVLSKLKAPESIARYLVLLGAFADDDSDKNEQLRAKNPTLERVTSTYAPMNGTENDARSISGSFYGPNGAGDSFENINFDRFSDRRSIYSAAQNRSMNDSRNYTLGEVSIPYFENNVREEDILKYISFTLVGTTSNLFPLRDGEVLLPEELSNSESGLLHLVMELGLVYQKLAGSIEIFKFKKSPSAIKNAIMSYIFEEITDYMKLVNALSNKKTFSLRSMLADLLDELVKLRFLHHLTKKLEIESGDKLLSSLHHYHNYGDVTIRNCASSLLRYSLEPFFNFLRSWLVDGELADKAGEFFISWSSDNHLQNRDIKVEYNPERIPEFFPKDLGDKIYLIGKTNIFLNRYCKESKWCTSFAQRLNVLLNRLKSSKVFFFSDSSFNKLIVDQYSEINNYFNYIIHTKYHLMDILKALRDFLLMGKGDFLQDVITSGSDLLNDPSNTLSGHQLTKLLQDAVLKTTVRHLLNVSDEFNAVNNLDARLLEIGHGNIGWDVFTLDYQLHPPISLILNDETNQHKRDYLKVFNYLWKFKRLEALFTEEWRKQKNLRQRNLHVVIFRKINRVRLIQNFLRGFSHSIERFIFEEIINSNYEALIEELKLENNVSKIPIVKTAKDFKVSKTILKPSEDYLNTLNQTQRSFEEKKHGYKELSIDALRTLHVDYLSSITKHKLINGSNPNSKGKFSKKLYIYQLNSLINLVFKFMITVKEFNVLVDELENLSKFDDVIGEDDHLHARFSIIYNNTLKIFNEFNAGLKVFISDLSNDDDMNLRYLGISLNQ